MRPVSRKRQARDRAYKQARKQVAERSEGRCEANVTVACTGRYEETHHLQGRRVPDPHRLDNLVGLCRSCHAWAHEFPVEARARGLMVSRLGKVGDFTGRRP